MIINLLYKLNFEVSQATNRTMWRIHKQLIIQQHFFFLNAFLVPQTRQNHVASGRTGMTRVLAIQDWGCIYANYMYIYVCMYVYVYMDVYTNVMYVCTYLGVLTYAGQYCIGYVATRYWSLPPQAHTSPEHNNRRYSPRPYLAYKSRPQSAHVCMYVCMYVYMYACMYVCMYACVCM